MHRCFARLISAPGFSLDEEESHHVLHVLRMREGQELEVTDGKGGLALCSIVSLSKKQVHLEIINRHTAPEPSRRLHIAIAPTKNADRLEWFVEKATEMGVASITPVVCRHSERKHTGTSRLSKIIVAASKQSGQLWFPLLHETVNFDEVLKFRNESGSKFIAHCRGQENKVPFADVADASEALVLIGPEGDFSPDEVEAALAAGFQPVSLGDSRLRTETAGLVAVAAFYLSR